MKKIVGSIQILLYLLGALVLAIVFFSLVVRMHRDQVEGAAQVPRYKADCSGALWYSSATPAVACYDVQTYVELTNHRSKSFDHYTAELTLPNGNDVTGDLADEYSAKLISESYTAEIWHGKLTRVLINNQVLRTYDNPEIVGQSDGVFTAMLVATGIFFTLIVILLSVVLVKGLQQVP